MEYALTIPMGSEQLFSIVHRGNSTNEKAVLLIVGGPQYRIGSHRQFVQLARKLAAQGYTVMRLDTQGMGESSGIKKPFDEINQDIDAAITALIEAESYIQKVTLWGLCDAASAALIYAHKDERVNGLVLLNPWLENVQARAKTMVKFYYVQRLFSKGFWKKLFSGKIDVMSSIKGAQYFVKESVKPNTYQSDSGTVNYQQRMLTGFQTFTGKLCFILSGQDITAREFEEQTNDKAWRKLQGKNCQVHKLTSADHTFSIKEDKAKVEEITTGFLNKL